MKLKIKSNVEWDHKEEFIKATVKHLLQFVYYHAMFSLRKRKPKQQQNQLAKREENRLKEDSLFNTVWIWNKQSLVFSDGTTFKDRCIIFSFLSIMLLASCYLCLWFTSSKSSDMSR